MADLLLNKQPEKMLAFYRNGLLFAFNFHPSKSLTDVLVPVHQPGEYKVVLSTDDPKYGGSGILNTGIMEAFPVKGNFLHRVRVNVPPMGVTVLERIDKENEGLCP
jgi:1,4-alpha-glucan branching enzyme